MKKIYNLGGAEQSNRASEVFCGSAYHMVAFAVTFPTI